jgi:hypothetical protein
LNESKNSIFPPKRVPETLFGFSEKRIEFVHFQRKDDLETYQLELQFEKIEYCDMTSAQQSYLVASNRSIATFPLSPSHKNLLLKAGYKTSSDFQDVRAVELSKGEHRGECQISSMI